MRVDIAGHDLLPTSFHVQNVNVRAHAELSYIAIYYRFVARASGCDFAWGDTSWAISASQDAHTRMHMRGKGKYEKESKFQKGTIQLNLIAIGNIKSSHHPLRCQIDRKEKIVHRMYSRLLG